MYIVAIGLFLVAIQAVCDGAPGPAFPGPRFSVDLSFKENPAEKRAVRCTPDRSQRCSRYKEWNFCDRRSRHYNYMQRNCYATCNNCKRAPTPPPKAARCIPDRSQRCSRYKERNFCDRRSRHYNYMQRNCYATCNNCKRPPTTPPKAERCTQEQYDKRKGCPYFEAKGYCDRQNRYYHFMRENCYATCGNCKMPPTPAPKLDKNACLSAHNARRARHGARPLTWDDTLAHHAQEWADHLLGIGRMVHATGTGEGENLAHGWDVKVLTCEEAMTGWYDKEEPLYNYNKPGFSKPTGHFTQVVWKGSNKVGVALAHKRRRDGMIESFIVARYSPPGNIHGQFVKNVGRKRP